MKFLCVCQGGNCRSVAMACALKENGQEALSVGWETATEKTLMMLLEWADAVVVMQENMIRRLQEKLGSDKLNLRKILIVDVGPDIFGTPTHPSLLPYVRGIAEDWKKKGFSLQSATGHRLPV